VEGIMSIDSLPTAVPRTTTRRASRASRAQHLVTADETSLTELEALLVTLPLCSTGRIFVEVPDASYITDLEVPQRMTLTWLDRSRRSGEPGTSRACAPGAALTRAVTAWADEMICDESDDTRVALLGGFLGTADILEHLTDRRGVSPEAITTPQRYGLLAR
jgi:hypothetical protein